MFNDLIPYISGSLEINCSYFTDFFTTFSLLLAIVFYLLFNDPSITVTSV